ncbi:MAG: lipopolysaccharide biosynthesis protein [Actinomycetota bacterium]|nr:lipopolysaccharide biosynthesis protein [Actinomycetota bacterium]
MTTPDPNQGPIDATEPLDAPDVADDTTGLAEEPETSLLERALRAAGSDAARYIPVRFIPALTSLVTTPIFTRWIDKADYGAFYLISPIASLVAAVSVGWLQSSTVRFYWPSHKKGKVDAFLSTVIWTGLTSLVAFALACAIGVWLGAAHIDAAIMRLIPMSLFYFITFTWAGLLLQVLRAANRSASYAKLSIGVTLLVTAISVGLVLAGWGATGIFAGAAIGNLVFLPFMLRAVREEGDIVPHGLDRPLLREMLVYGAPLVPVGLAGWALAVLDRFVIQAFRGPSEVGLYAVAYSLGDKIMQLVTMPLILTMMPSLTEAYEKRGQRLAEQMQTHFTRYFALLTLPLLTGLTITSQVFMRVFTGPDYREAYAVLPIVAAGSMLGQLANIAGTGLGMHKKTRLIMVNTLVAAAFNVAANIVLVPRIGYMASAINTVAAYGILLFMTWLQSRRYMRWLLPWESLVRIALASAGMGAVVWGTTLILPATLWALIAEVCIGVAVYGTLLVAFGGVRAEERAFVRTLAARGMARLRR